MYIDARSVAKHLEDEHEIVFILVHFKIITNIGKKYKTHLSSLSLTVIAYGLERT